MELHLYNEKVPICKFNYDVVYSSEQRNILLNNYTYQCL